MALTAQGPFSEAVGGSTGGAGERRGSRAAFRDLFARTDAAMLLATDERLYVDANPAACQLLGVPRGEIVGRRPGHFTPPEAGAELDAIWERLLAEGTVSGTFQLSLPSGAAVNVDFSATARIEPGLHLIILLRAGGDAGFAEPDAEEPAVLSPREREVMGMVALGAMGEEIAQRLDISPETVRNHVRSARAKLGARTRAHAIALAIERGEIRI